MYLPELEVCEWVVVEDESLKVYQPPYLWWEGLEVVVSAIEVKQVSTVDEYLCWDLHDTGK